MFACLLSALAYAALFPPLQWSWLAWLALVPFFTALRASSWRRRLWLGALWGMVSNFAVGFWVPSAIAVYYERPWWFGPLFCAGASMVFWTPYYALFALLSAPLRRLTPRSVQPLSLAALWVSAEVGRASLMTGAPWLPLGYALVPHLWWSQAADLGGVYLLSFVVVVTNAAVSESLPLLRSGFAARRGDLALRLGVAVFFAVALGSYGAWRVAQPLPAGAAVTTRIVQGNNQEGAFWRPGAYGKGFETYLALSQADLPDSKLSHRSAGAVATSARPQVLIWPEAAVTMFLARDNYHQQRVRNLLQSLQADLLVGTPHYDDADPAVPRYLNSAYYITAQSGIVARYDKTHLLPFVEYFPLNIDFLRRRFERVRTFVPGDTSELLKTRFGPTAVVICFEAIFPRLVGSLMRRGAAVLVVLSNDAWLGNGAGPEQHLAMIRLRAIENRTWVVRSTTTGISAVIDPFGRVVQRAPLFEKAVLDAAITPLHVQTPYERAGDAFAVACVLASLCLAAAAGVRHLRRRRQQLGGA